MIVSVAQTQLFILALTRILAVLSRVPVLGGENIPLPVRIGLGVMLTITLLPWQPVSAQVEPLGLFAFAISVARELLIGVLVGYAVELAFGAIHLAGEMMGLGSGFAAGRVFNPALGDGSPAFAQLFNLSAILLFLIIDGHHQLLIALARTFEIVPLNSALPLALLETVGAQAAQLITAGVQLGLPVMSALFLADLALGLLARVAPQIQVFFLGLPLKVALAFVALGLVFVVLIPGIEAIFRDIGPRMLSLLE